jgi:hypothetical protein
MISENRVKFPQGMVVARLGSTEINWMRLKFMNQALAHISSTNSKHQVTYLVFSKSLREQLGLDTSTNFLRPAGICAFTFFPAAQNRDGGCVSRVEFLAV